MASPRSAQIRARLEHKKRIAPLFDPSISLATQRAELDKSGKRAVPLPGQQIEPISAGGIPGEWVKVGAQTSSRQVLLYIHGGAFVAGSCLSSRSVAARLADASELPVLALDYRLAPEHSFPAAVEDVIVAYRWLLASGMQAHEIALAGDSSGGNLALAALLSLRDVGESLPAAVVLLSPWIDLTETSASRSTHAEADPYLTPQFMRVAAKHYLGAINPRTSPASPLFGDLAGLPPVLIQVGTDEIFLDDSLLLAQRMREVGGAVTLEIWEGMWHVWHYFAALIPEGQQSFDQIGKFVRTQLDQAREAQRAREPTESDYFQQLQQRAIQLRRRYIEPSMADVLELPRKLRDLFHWLVQQGEAELAQVAAHLNQDVVTTRTQLSNLIVRGFVQEREGEDEGLLHYRVRMRARRGRLVSDELKQSLGSDIAVGFKKEAK
jgi:epsilon-lactone hydrolase